MTFLGITLVLRLLILSSMVENILLSHSWKLQMLMSSLEEGCSTYSLRPGTTCLASCQVILTSYLYLRPLEKSFLI